MMEPIHTQYLDRLDRWLCAPVETEGRTADDGSTDSRRRLSDALSHSGSLVDLVGEQEAQRYRLVLRQCRSRLEDLLQHADTLSQSTINASSNASERRRSLGGAGRIIARLHGMGHESGRRFDPSLQRDYLDQLLVASGAPGNDESDGLPESTCNRTRDTEQSAAVLAHLLHELTRLDQASTTTEQAQEIMSELLDVCDVLSLMSTDAVLALSEHYQANGRHWRARRLLRSRLETAPDDRDVQSAMAYCLARDNRAVRDWRKVRAAFDTALASSPDDAGLHREFADILLQTGRVEHALSHFEHALRRWPQDPQLQERAAHARRLCKVIEDARADDAIAAVTPSERERAESRFDASTLEVIARLYREHGTLCFHGLFDVALLESCHSRFLDDYKDYLGDKPQADALQIGNRRFQVSLELDGPFNDARFYANPFLLGVMQRLIGRKVIIGSTVCATSLPGARDQHLHKDHRALFTSDPDDEPVSLPPVAVTAMIPLVPLDETVGTTVVKKKSHRCARRQSERLPSQIPCMPLGSCFLMDLSLSHRGQGNRSDRVRPIVNMQYTQPWFVDNKNFRKQPPLKISATAYQKISETHRSLFDWATQPGPRVER